MHGKAKRSIVAAAAVAAAGLFGSLSYDGQMVAQPGLRTVHQDVALVNVGDGLDVDDTALAAATATQTSFLTAENTFNNEAYLAFLGPTGFEHSLYTSLGTNAAVLLDTYGASGALPLLPTDLGYTYIFDGATTQYVDGVYADGLLGEDYLNQALGISATDSETSILAQIANDHFLNLSTTLAGEVPGTAAVGTSTFDGDLAGLAQGAFTQSFTDLSGYFTYLSDNSTALEAANIGLTTLLSDVSSGLSTTVSGLSGDVTSILTSLGGLL